MKIEKYVCDRCGKEVESHLIRKMSWDVGGAKPIKVESDFCDWCMGEIVKFALKKLIRPMLQFQLAILGWKITFPKVKNQRPR